MKNKTNLDIQFDTWWDMIKLNGTSVVPTTNISYEVAYNKKSEEVLRINRRVNGIFTDKPCSKTAARRNFYALKSGYYPDGTKVTDKNIKSMSVFRSIYKHFNNFIYTNQIINLSSKRVFEVLAEKNAEISC